MHMVAIENEFRAPASAFENWSQNTKNARRGPLCSIVINREDPPYPGLRKIWTVPPWKMTNEKM